MVFAYTNNQTDIDTSKKNLTKTFLSAVMKVEHRSFDHRDKTNINK